MKIVAIFIFTFSIFNVLASKASASMNWSGSWTLASSKACSKNVVYEDALFALFMKQYAWTFTSENTVKETMLVENCPATITYDVEFLPASLEGDAGHMKRMKLTRKHFSSKCLRMDARPVTMELSYIAYPDFFETYELITTPQGACPQGTYVVTQFKRAQ